MASSQVEIIASSSPFGCVLRDRNQNNHQLRTNAFSKNFNDLVVQTQLGSCRNPGSNENSHPGIDLADLWVHHPQPTSTSTSSSNEDNHHGWEMGRARISQHSNSHQNSHQHNLDYTDLWVHNPPRNNDENSQNNSTSGGKCDRKCEIGVSSGPLASSPGGRTHDGAQSQPVSRVRSPEGPLRPVSSSGERRSLETGHASTSQKEKSQKDKSSPSPSPSSPVLASQTADSCSMEVPNLGAVSSLVQKWRSFEGKRSSSGGSSCSGGSALAGNVSFVEAPAAGGSDACEESIDIRPDTPTLSEESNGDWGTGSSASPGRDFDTAENERIRVADIIRKLSSNGEEQHDRDQAIFHESSLPCCIRTFMDQSPFAPFCCSHLIRGRQAFSDFQMQMERERHKELDALAETKAVSKFSHRGRIQVCCKSFNYLFVPFLHSEKL